MSKSQMGRPVIFSPKTEIRTTNIKAMTADGDRLFRKARARLKTLTKWPTDPSDADTVEFLARGEAATVAYLEKRRK